MRDTFAISKKKYGGTSGKWLTREEESVRAGE